MLWTWAGRESCLWELYSNFKTWKYTVIFFAKHCDVNFQTCEKKSSSQYHMHRTYANLPKLPERNRSHCLLEVVCAKKAALWITCYRLLMSRVELRGVRSFSSCPICGNGSTGAQEQGEEAPTHSWPRIPRGRALWRERWRGHPSSR